MVLPSGWSLMLCKCLQLKSEALRVNIGCQDSCSLLLCHRKVAPASRDSSKGQEAAFPGDLTDVTKFYMASVDTNNC